MGVTVNFMFICLVFSELPGYMVCCLGKFLGIIVSNIYSVSFILLVFPFHVCYTVCSCPIVMDTLLVFSFPYFFFLLVFEGFIGISSSSEILSLAVSHLLISPSKTSFVSIVVFVSTFLLVYS